MNNVSCRLFASPIENWSPGISSWGSKECILNVLWVMTTHYDVEWFPADPQSLLQLDYILVNSHKLFHCWWQKQSAMRTKPKHMPDSTKRLRKDLKEKNEEQFLSPSSGHGAPICPCWWLLESSTIFAVTTSNTLLLRNELPSGSASGEGMALGGRAWVAPLWVSTLST